MTDNTNIDDTKQQYQNILNQYAIPPFATKPPQSNLFRNIFFVALFIFIAVIGVIAYTLTKQPATPTPTSTPTPNPTTAPINKCVLNEKEYNVGESFQSADGCNTCSCASDLTITCTEKTCVPTPTATPTANLTQNWKTYTDSTHKFSFKYPIDWTLNNLGEIIIIKNSLSDKFTFYFIEEGLGRGYEGIMTFIKYDASINNNNIVLTNKTEKTSKTLETINGSIPTKGYAIVTTTDNTSNGYQYTFLMEGNDTSDVNKSTLLFEKIINSINFIK